MGWRPPPWLHRCRCEVFVELRDGVIEPHFVGLGVCEDSGVWIAPHDRPGGTGSSRPTEAESIGTIEHGEGPEAVAQKS